MNASSSLAGLRVVVITGASDGIGAEMARQLAVRDEDGLALVRDLPGDSLPTTGHLLSVLARSLGTTPAGLRDDYRRHTRRARRVVERLFYGREGKG